jgi:cystathionine beta-lyase
MNDLTACVVTPQVSTEGFDPLGVAVHRASTIVFKDAAAYEARGQRGHNGYAYGLYGTPTTRTLEEKLTLLERGTRTFLAPSGQSANALAVLPFLSAGDKILIVDTAYPPMRDFALRDLARMGIVVDFYDPLSIDDLESRLDGRTRIIWCESPGSTTMEVQDLPRISALAKKAGALVGFDNTWATPLNFKPLLHGADIVTEALTKYVSGHSDVLMGSITVGSETLIEPIRGLIGRYGIGVSSDDASLVLRGFETLGVRLKHSSEVAQRLMDRIATNPLVAAVLHPARADCPGHELWKRDFLGGSAVFGVLFKPEAADHVAEAMNTFRIFAIGASWGGTRSLAAPMPVKPHRTATQWQEADLVLRLNIGLESEEDLAADIDRFLDQLGRSTTAPERALRAAAVK